MSAVSAGTRSGPLQFQDLDPHSSPDLVYFSSVSENTRRFVERLDRVAVRIPLRPGVDGMIDPDNRALIRGVITSGNTNFGEHYCIAGPIVSAKCRVPELYRFELLGTDRDVARVTEGLREFWSAQPPAPTHRKDTA